MAEYRPIKTKIWNDTWFLSLTPEEKSVWFFLLTNQNVHISGIYELPISLISPLVGSSKGEEILTKFEDDGKIVYKNGFIFIKNYLKNQTQQINKIGSVKDNVTKSILAYLSENKQLISLFNLQDEAPYKPLVRPLPKGLKIKGLKIKDEILSVETDGVKELMDIFYKINPTLNWGNKTTRKACSDLINKSGLDGAKKLCEYAVSVQGEKYAPTIVTPYQLWTKLSELKIYYDKQNKSNLTII